MKPVTPEAPAPGLWLGFDYGAWRIGVALGDTRIGSARPLTTLQARNTHQIDWAAIAALIQEWQPVGCVVGWPLTDHGEPYPIADFIARFAQRLHGRFCLPIHFADERLSSEQAERRLGNRLGNAALQKTPGLIDAGAAAIILDTFLHQTQPAPRPPLTHARPARTST
ncbi:Holliday junction resolvase RuvX [Halothiobacillus sp. DCM-1]|uniref:Holliday junction resolvase RuvX n=1 Tax=Halothiobacillus sp. DCM-1 TaxID=3112558 RepID=UPI00324EF22D